MGMYGHLRQIAPSDLERLQGNPDAVRQLIHGKIDATAEKTRAVLERVQKLVLDARPGGATLDPAIQERVRAQVLTELEGTVTLAHDGPTEDGLGLEKSWHVLHYLLTGKAEDAPPPLGNAILGGQEIGEDLGYGPARFLTPQQVREVAIALSSFSKDELVSRFDLKAMLAAKIYPVKDKGELELAQHYFDHLLHYYADAAANGNAMLLYIE